MEDKRKSNKGRPRKLDQRDERKVVRNLKRLWKQRASFSAKKIHEESGMKHVTVKAITRVLRKNGYRYLQSRKQGLLSEKAKKRRVKAAREVKKYDQAFWRHSIAFHYDGVGFAH